MVQTRAQRARAQATAHMTPTKTGIVRGPLLKEGYTPQTNTLFEHGFSSGTPEDIWRANRGLPPMSPILEEDGSVRLDFGLGDPVVEPELAPPPMTLTDGNVAILQGLQNGEFNVDSIERISGEQEMAAGAGAGFTGLAYMILLRKSLFGPIAASLGGVSAIMFGVSYLIGDTDAQVRNIESFEIDQEIRWRKWEQENQISRADIFQYAVTDYQIKALQDAGGGYTLAKDWYKYKPGYTITEEDVLEVEAELEAKIQAAPSPPDYVAPSALSTMKKNAWKLGTIPLFFVVLLVLWRRRKKKRRK